MSKSESTGAGRRKRPAARRAPSGDEAAPSAVESDEASPDLAASPDAIEPDKTESARASRGANDAREVGVHKRATARRVPAGAQEASGVRPRVPSSSGVADGNTQSSSKGATPATPPRDAVAAIRARAEAAARANQAVDSVARARASTLAAPRAHASAASATSREGAARPHAQGHGETAAQSSGRASGTADARVAARDESEAAARARAAQLTLAAARARAALSVGGGAEVASAGEHAGLLAELARMPAANAEPTAMTPMTPMHAATRSAVRAPTGTSLLSKWGRFALRNRSEQVDDFGLDPTYETSLRPFFEKILHGYFRAEIEGVEHIPARGRAILVCNHSGALPWDGIMLRTALRLHHAARRELRWLVEDHVFHAPFLGTFVNRIGAVRACQENAERLLNGEELVAVFPEGIKGIAKPYSERYKLQRFGRGGYVRLALRTGAPVIPVAIVGAEETYPLLYKVNAFSKSVGLPFIPVTPTFPWLGPLGMAPLPSRWRIRIGAPIREIGRHEAEVAKDEVLVQELNECTRAAVRDLLDHALKQRGHNAFV